MTLSADELKRLEQSVKDAADQRKKIRTRPKAQPTKKQKQIEHLSDKQIKELRELQFQLGSIIHKNSHIMASRKKDEHTLTKRDLRKGKNNNLGVEKIHSESSLKDLMKISNQLVKYCYEFYGISELKEIRPRMIESFCRGKMEDQKWTYSTLGTRISQIKKIGESASKEGIKHFSRIVTKNTKELKKEFRPQGKLKDHRIRGKKANGEGLSLREARIISKHASRIYGPLAEIMIDILIEAGARAGELMKLKWNISILVQGQWI